MKYLVSIVAALGALATVFGPAIQAAIAHHPAIAAVLASAYAILAHFVPSPVSK